MKGVKKTLLTLQKFERGCLEPVLSVITVNESKNRGQTKTEDFLDSHNADVCLSEGYG